MRRPIEDGLSLLAGLGVGTAIMYLLDPNSGADRRRSIAESALNTVDYAREAISTGGDAISRGARGAYEGLSEGISSGTSRASDYSSRLSRRVSEGAHNWIPSRYREEEESTVGTVATYAGGGLALFALGAGLAYLFDPDRGRGRRTQLSQQLAARGRDVSDFARRSGRHYANKARGYTATAKSAVQKITSGQSKNDLGESNQSESSPANSI